MRVQRAYALVGPARDVSDVGAGRLEDALGLLPTGCNSSLGLPFRLEDLVHRGVYGGFRGAFALTRQVTLPRNNRGPSNIHPP